MEQTTSQIARRAALSPPPAAPPGPAARVRPRGRKSAAFVVLERRMRSTWYARSEAERSTHPLACRTAGFVPYTPHQRPLVAIHGLSTTSEGLDPRGAQRRSPRAPRAARLHHQLHSRAHGRAPDHVAADTESLSVPARHARTPSQLRHLSARGRRSVPALSRTQRPGSAARGTRVRLRHGTHLRPGRNVAATRRLPL